LYLATLSAERRLAVADIAQRYGVPIIEDDAYGCLPQQRLTPLATLAPQLTFYVAGLSKIVGAGLRIGYLVLPNVRYTARLKSTLASLAVMANPTMLALARHSPIIDDHIVDYRNISLWKQYYTHTAIGRDLDSPPD
jgi:DNA-binding transcriptional MocR family regulator